MFYVRRYFGRKRLLKKNENWVDNSDHLVYPSYSYWTLGYALSLEGAKKLLGILIGNNYGFDCFCFQIDQFVFFLSFTAARPLEQLIPVDEFLPIMFDQHQNITWKKAFPNRNLVAWSTAPLLVFPTHYTGEDGYFSDTEQSDTVNLLGTHTI